MCSYSFSMLLFVLKYMVTLFWISSSMWKPQNEFNLELPLWTVTGNIQCITEGSCAGSSLTLPLVVHTWPTPSCLPLSLLYPMTTLIIRSCLLHAHPWWASTSLSLALMEVLCRLEWLTPSQQMLVKDHCPLALRMGLPLRGGEAWFDQMSSIRYRRSRTINKVFWSEYWACRAHFSLLYSNN